MIFYDAFIDTYTSEDNGTTIIIDEDGAATVTVLAEYINECETDPDTPKPRNREERRSRKKKRCKRK